MSRVKIEPIKQHIGARVYVDPEALSDDAVVAEIVESLNDRGVLAFPRLNLTDAQQLAFTDKLGGRVNYFTEAVKDEVFRLTLDPKINDLPDTVHVTYFWHMDGTSQSELPPPKATLLSARQAASKGGETEFASTFAGYETLSAEDKAELEGLRALHSTRSLMRPLTDTPTEEQLARWARNSVDKKHPIVWTQKSGRKSLVLGQSADYIVDMPLADGRALLARLLDWTVQPAFRYRHKWQDGDLLMWNNYGVLHRALPYERSSGRLMHRTTVAGYEHIAA